MGAVDATESSVIRGVCLRFDEPGVSFLSELGERDRAEVVTRPEPAFERSELTDLELRCDAVGPNMLSSQMAGHIVARNYGPAQLTALFSFRHLFLPNFCNERSSHKSNS